MDKKTKFLFILITVIFVTASLWKFYIFFIKKDYLVYDRIPCDPYSEVCFASSCDVEDTSCEVEYYKKIELMGYDYTECKLADDCIQEKCFVQNSSCKVTICSEEELEEGESCTDLIGKNPDDNITPDTVDSIDLESSSTIGIGDDQ